MNQVNLIGRLTSDPEVSDKATKYTLAVDRRFKRDGDPDADFIRCVCFGKTAEFAGKYLRKGTKIGVSGRIQTGSYTNKDGVKVYTTDVVIENQEFVERKVETAVQPKAETPEDRWLAVPDGYKDELPFA